MANNHNRIPRPVVKRLSRYLQRFEQASRRGVKTLTSTSLAEGLDMTSALVRRDLGHLKRIGRPGVGYEVEGMIEQLRKILGTDEVRNVIVVGVGGLGGALLCHEGFHKRGFEIVAAFDIDEAKIGKTVGGVKIRAMSDLSAVVRRHEVKMAILTTPADAGANVLPLLHRAGITGILNFTPVTLLVPPGVSIAQVDIAARLERLSYSVHASNNPSD